MGKTKKPRRSSLEVFKDKLQRMINECDRKRNHAKEDFRWWIHRLETLEEVQQLAEKIKE